MQTFLPYPSFEETVKCLDYRRLGKQRVEARQVIENLLIGGNWVYHPAVRMWRGFENALCHYMNVCIYEWVSRGFRNTMLIAEISRPVEMPPWMGMHELHASHRSNLLRKHEEWYSQFGWTEPATLPYVWPV